MCTTCLTYTLDESACMRTNIVIDDALMKRAMRASGAKTKREAVERGLELMVRLAKQAKLIRSARGKLHWEGDLKKMRRDRFAKE
jgi:Arc/MetJ family transcription regulator